MSELTSLPVVPLRGVTIFPGMTLHFDVGRKSTLAVIRRALQTGSDVFFITQRDITVQKPGVEDLYEVGVVGTIRQSVKLPGERDTIRVVAEGKYRAKIGSVEKTSPYFCMTPVRLNDSFELPENEKTDPELLRLANLFAIRHFFDDYCEKIPQMSPDILNVVFDSPDLSEVTDLIAGNIMLPTPDKQMLLEELNVYNRSQILSVMLARETEIMTIDEELEEKVHKSMDDNQREYYLREQIKAANDELESLCGEDETGLKQKILSSGMKQEAKDKLLSELERMKRLTSASVDANVIRSYIEKCLELPWGVYTKENSNLKKAVDILEKDHYGLKEVKQRITEMLAAMIISPELKGQIICLAGPPGVGKTSVAKSIARATGRKYARISLGGVRDEAEIRGHRKTYVGAMPGRIVASLIEAGSSNPLILLDEIDKLSVGDFRGDPAAALLEVLDGEQNFSFRDNYIELPVDLSNVLFITTANDKTAIPPALLDRMEIIDIPSYTYEEKLHIAKKHLIPKQMKAHNIKSANLKFTDSSIRLLVDGYTREAGVRVLERKIAAVCRKEAVRLADGDTAKLTVTDKNLPELLGTVKYRPDDNRHEPAVGLVNGLAWTSVGGELLQVEIAVLDGTGKLELTGSLGDVMKESARAAVSFVRSRTALYGIDPDFYKNKDIHIHFPEGAVPKDGPSAGITITTCLVSALTGRAVRGTVAMTGEITLRGRVLAIGGLREKSMAAYKDGIKEVFIPFDNVPDLDEIDDAVRSALVFIPVKTADDVLENVLLPAETQEAPAKLSKEKTDAVIPAEKNEIGRSKKSGIVCGERI